MATEKITAQQRKYFVERIEASINSKVQDLQHARAAKVQSISDTVFQDYLKQASVYDDLNDFKIVDAQNSVLSSKLSAVYNEIKRTFDDQPDYKSGWPSVYNGSSYKCIHDAFRFACAQLGKKTEDETPEGKLIKHLESKKRQALDELHGLNDLNGLKETVNNILAGAGIPLLGDSSEKLD